MFFFITSHHITSHHLLCEQLNEIVEAGVQLWLIAGTPPAKNDFEQLQLHTTEVQWSVVPFVCEFLICAN